MKKMNLSDIIITEDFAMHAPSQKKMEECRDYYIKYNRFDRNIVITPDNVLVDGYCAYLVAKEYGLNEVKVQVFELCINHNAASYRNKITTYIYGTHQGDNKEYVWRVPNSWTGWENGLEIGDMILVYTKHGVRSITVTRVEMSDKAPTDAKISKVFKRL